MQLAGYSLTQVLTLLGGASAAVIALYLLRTRRRRIAVPFIGLWEPLLRERRASRLFDRLKHLLSLLLALSIVALLSLALGDPREPEGSPDVEHVLLLVDAGVTMGATDVAPSRLQAALDMAEGLVAAAGPRHRMLVAQLDAGVTPLSTMSEDPRALRDALQRVRLTDLPTDQDRGIRYALSALAGRAQARVVLLSDRATPLPPAQTQALSRAGIGLRFEPFGLRAENAAISAFAVRRYPLDRNRSELLVELHNASETVRDVELTLLGGGRPVDVQRLTLQPDTGSRRVYDDITGVDRTLSATIRTLDGSDDLAADNRAQAVLPERERMRVLCVTEGNRYLEAALLLDEYLDVDVVSPGEYAGAGEHDAVIFDRSLPDRAPGVPAFYIRPDPELGGLSPLEVKGEVERPFFDRLERDHPVLRFTALRDANVARALRLVPGPEDHAIGGDAGAPLIVTGQRAGAPFLALAFALEDSDLPLRVAWPMLLLNTLDWFTAEQSGWQSSYGVGETVAVDLPDGARGLTLEGPDGERRPLADPEPGTPLMVTLERAGVHTLRWDGGERALAVNLQDATLRPLVPLEALDVAGRPGTRPQVRATEAGPPPWVLLTLCAVALLLLEWLTFHRRWTV
ncbi:MAG: VWA domain-containing protein [Myxococcales bacterium]|jgi:hypothetical protein